MKCCCGSSPSKSPSRLHGYAVDPYDPGPLPVAPLNPKGDFMHNMAPQWPEPEPSFDEDNDAEGEVFLQPGPLTTVVPSVNNARGMRNGANQRTSISSSWSSLFNVPDGSGGGGGGLSLVGGNGPLAAFNNDGTSSSVRSSVVSGSVGGGGPRVAFVNGRRGLNNGGGPGSVAGSSIS